MGSPYKTFILPSKRSDGGRFLSLPNPASGISHRHFFDPELGLYEFTAVASTQFAPRSILFTSKTRDDDSESTKKACIAKKAEVFVATPVDVLFFMLPIIAPTDRTSTSKMFQPLDDILDSQSELSSHLRHILYNHSLRPTIERRMEAVCDTMDAGDERLYRFNDTKLLAELVAKAHRMIDQGLPTSLEQNFIRKALTPPLMSVKREVATVITTAIITSESTASTNFKPDIEDIQELETVETQSSSTTTVSLTPSGQLPGVSTPATEPPAIDDLSIPENVARLLRLRIALLFMKDSYLQPHLSSRIDEMLQSPETPIDFKPLDERLKELAELRVQALASRAIGDIGRKRGFEDEDNDSERGAAKRKKEEEKKAKAAESRAVKELKRVNTAGMKKMSDFFKKKS